MKKEMLPIAKLFKNGVESHPIFAVAKSGSSFSKIIPIIRKLEAVLEVLVPDYFAQNNIRFSHGVFPIIRSSGGTRND